MCDCNRLIGMNKLIFSFILFIWFAACSSYHTVLTEQDTTSYKMVVDSIKSSGTELGQLRVWNFITDDNRMDNVRIGTLYRKGEAVGSIQIRKTDSLYNVKIIDYLKKKK